MGELTIAKTTLITALVSFIAFLLRSIDALVLVLVFMIVLDTITGYITAGFFKKSKKTITGGLSSCISKEGTKKKAMTVVVVGSIIGLDYGLNSIGITEFKTLKDAIIIFYIADECLSIIENAGLCGLPIPKKLKDVLEVLKREDSDDGLDKK